MGIGNVRKAVDKIDPNINEILGWTEEIEDNVFQKLCVQENESLEAPNL